MHKECEWQYFQVEVDRDCSLVRNAPSLNRVLLFKCKSTICYHAKFNNFMTCLIDFTSHMDGMWDLQLVISIQIVERYFSFEPSCSPLFIVPVDKKHCKCMPVLNGRWSWDASHPCNHQTEIGQQALFTEYGALRGCNFKVFIGIFVKMKQKSRWITAFLVHRTISQIILLQGGFLT